MRLRGNGRGAQTQYRNHAEEFCRIFHLELPSVYFGYLLLRFFLFGLSAFAVFTGSKREGVGKVTKRQNLKHLSSKPHRKRNFPHLGFKTHPAEARFTSVTV